MGSGAVSVAAPDTVPRTLAHIVAVVAHSEGISHGRIPVWRSDGSECEMREKDLYCVEWRGKVVRERWVASR
jgi:hypothetical protein